MQGTSVQPINLAGCHLRDTLEPAAADQPWGWLVPKEDGLAVPLRGPGLAIGRDAGRAAEIARHSGHGLSGRSSTWVNNIKVRKGQTAQLQEGNQIMLAQQQGAQRSVCFTYQVALPSGATAATQKGSSKSDAVGSQPWRPEAQPLQCGICMGALVAAVTLRPCGHSLCATCLSHHLGAQLQSGVTPSCPYGCTSPNLAVHADSALRLLVASSNMEQQQCLQGLHTQTSQPAAAQAMSQSPDTACNKDQEQGGLPTVPAVSGHGQQPQPGCLQAGASAGLEQQVLSGHVVHAARSAAAGHGVPADPNSQHLDRIMGYARAAICQLQDRGTPSGSASKDEQGHVASAHDRQPSSGADGGVMGSGAASWQLLPATSATQQNEQGQRAHQHRQQSVHTRSPVQLQPGFRGARPSQLTVPGWAGHHPEAGAESTPSDEPVEPAPLSPAFQPWLQPALPGHTSPGNVSDQGMEAGRHHQRWSEAHDRPTPPWSPLLPGSASTPPPTCSTTSSSRLDPQHSCELLRRCSSMLNSIQEGAEDELRSIPSRCSTQLQRLQGPWDNGQGGASACMTAAAEAAAVSPNPRLAMARVYTHAHFSGRAHASPGPGSYMPWSPMAQSAVSPLPRGRSSGMRRPSIGTPGSRGPPVCDPYGWASCGVQGRQWAEEVEYFDDEEGYDEYQDGDCGQEAGVTTYTWGLGGAAGSTASTRQVNLGASPNAASLGSSHTTHYCTHSFSVTTFSVTPSGSSPGGPYSIAASPFALREANLDILSEQDGSSEGLSSCPASAGYMRPHASISPRPSLDHRWLPLAAAASAAASMTPWRQGQGGGDTLLPDVQLRLPVPRFRRRSVDLSQLGSPATLLAAAADMMSPGGAASCGMGMSPGAAAAVAQARIEECLRSVPSTAAGGYTPGGAACNSSGHPMLTPGRWRPSRLRRPSAGPGAAASRGLDVAQASAQQPPRQAAALPSPGSAASAPATGRHHVSGPVGAMTSRSVVMERLSRTRSCVDDYLLLPEHSSPPAAGSSGTAAATVPGTSPHSGSTFDDTTTPGPTAQFPGLRPRHSMPAAMGLPASSSLCATSTAGSLGSWGTMTASPAGTSLGYSPPSPDMQTYSAFELQFQHWRQHPQIRPPVMRIEGALAHSPSAPPPCTTTECEALAGVTMSQLMDLDLDLDLASPVLKSPALKAQGSPVSPTLILASAAVRLQAQHKISSPPDSQVGGGLTTAQGSGATDAGCVGSRTATTGTPDGHTSSATPAISTQAAQGQVPTTPAGGSNAPAGMHLLCPLDDECLPVVLSALKARMVEAALSGLRQAATTPNAQAGLPALVQALEIMARLCWSDDEAREAVASSGGAAALVAAMRAYSGHPCVQAAACLCFMALVRGEGDVCLANQWHIAKAAGVEAVAAAMLRDPQDVSLQLAALMSLIPLSLENSMMQASVCYEALPAVMSALANHSADRTVQTKGLVLLGVLMQGNDEALQDAIRQRLLEAKAGRAICQALRAHGRVADDVLWAATYAGSMLIKAGNSTSVQVQAASQMANQHNIQTLLGECLQAYQNRCSAAQTCPDTMIVQGVKALLQVSSKQCWNNHVLYSVFLTAGVVGFYFLGNKLLQH